MLLLKSAALFVTAFAKAETIAASIIKAGFDQRNAAPGAMSSKFCRL
mgnify:CR=1 FL=1